MRRSTTRDDVPHLRRVTVDGAKNIISEVADTVTSLGQGLHKADQLNIDAATEACRSSPTFPEAIAYSRFLPNQTVPRYVRPKPPNVSHSLMVLLGGLSLASWARCHTALCAAGEQRRWTYFVISHPCVVPVNRAIYQRMAQDGCSLAIGVPARWRNEFHGGSFAPCPSPSRSRNSSRFHSCFRDGPSDTCLVNPRSILKAYRPSTLFIEAEAFSFSALQWGAAARSLQIPFGVQAAENLDRPMPAPVICIESGYSVTHDLLGRSIAAGEHARAWGARGDVVLLPHAVPLWDMSRIPSAVFTIGYAGRLVPEKGISDCTVDAFLRMTVSAELVLFGDGPMRPGVERGSSKLEWSLTSLTKGWPRHTRGSISSSCRCRAARRPGKNSSAVFSSKRCRVVSHSWARTAERSPG